MLLRMFRRWAEARGYGTELIEAEEQEEAGIKHGTLRISGPMAYGYLGGEVGVHRLVRISPFDAQQRRQTSFAAVEVIPDIDEDTTVDIEESDLRVDTYKAGGKGGQHVNKTESAVRITHLPTGIVVQCQNERSQHKNRGQAMKILKARILQMREAERNEELKGLYDNKGQIAWGSQIRSYVLAPYTLVKDHRTNCETGNVQAVIDGDIQPFIDAWLHHKLRSRKG
jgi:peptide chain release factor 2